MDAARGRFFASDCLRIRMDLFGHSDIRTFGDDRTRTGDRASRSHLSLALLEVL